GGYFYDFISAHTGRIVYLDIQVMRGVSRTGYFALDGVCRPKKPECNDRTTRIYRFKTEQGKNYWFEEAGVYKGFFKVGTESPSKGKQNQADFDTTRDLIVTPDFAE
ncbi:MAG TPA: hypothetical protein VHP34_10260, partial [Alphaproteobacteria bacterium]|nr:hypothetical protein [Alphaproteobacteria bacterium]